MKRRYHACCLGPTTIAAALLGAGCSGVTGPNDWNAGSEPSVEGSEPAAADGVGSEGNPAGPNAGGGMTPAGSADPNPAGSSPTGSTNPAASGETPQTGSGTPDPAGPEAQARPSIATRLSKAEFRYSVEDALGVVVPAAALEAATGGIPDDSGDGVFKRFGDSQTSVEQHASAYFEAAEAVALQLDMPALIAAHASCAEASVSCGQPVIAQLGRRLFRRSLADREQEVFTDLLQAALDSDEDLESGLRWVVQALLQSPQFLFHLEAETQGAAGSERALSGPELAARLASFIWVSLPDDELLALAESGELVEPEVLNGQVERMLADPKAQRLTEIFARDFSRAHLASFTGANDELRDALLESVVATFQYHLWEAGSSIAELFTTTEFVVNEAVAELLGVPHAGDGLERVDVSMLPERMGILTHPGMIAGMGDREVGSFVNRGKYLMERLLCRNPVAVPAALLTELEEFNQETTGLNEHERAELRMTRPECWGCHSQFEPLAFGFSRYDGAGRYVGESDADGKPLPLDGWVPVGAEADSPHYGNVIEYMQILATETPVQDCMTEHFLSFATARTTDGVAKAQAPLVGTTYREQGSTLQAMVAAVAQSPLFRRMTVVASDETAGGTP